MGRLSSSFIGLLFAAVIATGVQAQVAYSAGQVDAVYGNRTNGDAVIRRDGQTSPFRSYMALRSGDTIVVSTPDVAVVIYVAGASRPYRVTFANSPYRVPVVRAGQPPTGAWEMLASLDYLFTRSRREIPVYTITRGRVSPAPRVRAPPRLPAGPQFSP